MQLNVLYFAHARERAGCSDESVTCADGATVADLVAEIGARHPTLVPLLPYVRVAVNGAYATSETPLSEGAEIALIPPVSGGVGTPRVQLTEAPLDPAACRAAVLDDRH
ncbi:MAG: molybdopterin converting factor subunit 1, partial [Myxococcota bacterium]|nr:molybdopterin converting factor subunit 1 [Myxococcota bacterium]